jgi:hypothetical protein
MKEMGLNQPNLKGDTANLRINLLRNMKAVTSDNAEFPEYLWNQVLVPDGDWVQLQALSYIQVFALRWWKKQLIRRDFVQCFFKEHGMVRAPFH